MALERVSLQVGEGEFVCLVGPSGCGKTTLLNLVAGLEKPDAGEVTSDGKPVTGPGSDRVVMFQESALFPWLDVMGNVLFPLKIQKELDAKARRGMAHYYLDMVGLQAFRHASVHELSGGMKQRVALARALAPRPRVLLMDEPFASLDALTREQMYRDLQVIQSSQRRTVILVTHNVREAVCLGDRVVLRASEVEHSILLEGASVTDVGGRIESSLIGRNVSIYRTASKPRSFNFMLGDRSEVGLI